MAQVGRRVRPRINYAETAGSESDAESGSEAQSDADYSSGDDDEDHQSESESESEVSVVESELDDDNDSVDEPDDDILPDEEDNKLVYFDAIRERVMNEHRDYYTDNQGGVSRKVVQRCLRFIRQVDEAHPYFALHFDEHSPAIFTDKICETLENHYDIQALAENDGRGGIPRAFFKTRVVCRLYASLLERVKPNSQPDLKALAREIDMLDPIEYIKRCVDCAVIFLVRFEGDLPDELRKFFEVVRGQGNSSSSGWSRLVLGAVKTGNNSDPGDGHNRLLIPVLSNDEFENKRQMHICAHVPKDFELDKLLEFCKEKYEDVKLRLGKRHFTLVFSPFDSLFGLHWNSAASDELARRVAKELLNQQYERMGIPPPPGKIKFPRRGDPPIATDRTCPFYKVPSGFKLDTSKSRWDKRGMFCLIENTEGYALREDKFYNLQEEDWDQLFEGVHETFMSKINEIDTFPEGKFDLCVGIGFGHTFIKRFKVPLFNNDADRRKEKISKLAAEILPKFKDQYEYLRHGGRKYNQKMQYLANIASQKKFYSMSKMKLALIQVYCQYPLDKKTILESEI